MKNLALFAFMFLGLAGRAQDVNIPVRGVLIEGEEKVGEVRLANTPDGKVVLILSTNSSIDQVDSVMNHYQLKDYLVADSLHKFTAESDVMLFDVNGAFEWQDFASKLKIKRKDDTFIIKMGFDLAPQNFDNLNEYKSMEGYTIRFVCDGSMTDYYKTKKDCQSNCSGQCDSVKIYF